MGPATDYRDRLAPLTTRCRYCSAPILIAVTPRQKNMPVDAAPFARADVPPPSRFLLTFDSARATAPQSTRVGVDEAAYVYVTHLILCPGRMKAREEAQLRVSAPVLGARLGEHRAAMPTSLRRGKRWRR